MFLNAERFECIGNGHDECEINVYMKKKNHVKRVRKENKKEEKKKYEYRINLKSQSLLPVCSVPTNILKYHFERTRLQNGA